MYPHAGFKDSVVPTNGYQFHCPVVDRDALFIVCAFLRAKYMRGEGFSAHDCRCAMRGSKCPAARMLKKEWIAGERMFYDPTPTKHMLPKDILEDISKVALLPSHAGDYPLEPEQAARMFDGDLAVRRVTGEGAGQHEPVQKRTRRTKLEMEAARAGKPAEAKSTDIMSSLENAGDMGRMMNEALREELEPDQE